MTDDPIITMLHAERLRQGLSQRQVGELIGHTSYGSIYAWEAGVTSPTLRNLRRWAEALGVDLQARSRGGAP
jgi:transcriptional regulator with XRE-family HTH domain